jgi:hypothetical protein
VPVNGSLFTGTTAGGPLLIFMEIWLLAIDNFSCEPFIDNAWAGTPGGLPVTSATIGPREGEFRLDGLQTVTSDRWRFSLMRVYRGIGPGVHQFQVVCNVSQTEVTQFCGTTDGSCTFGFIELGG